MPWTTPTLREVRTMVRDDVAAALNGAAIIGNSVLRVISDSTGGLAHLVLRYIDWLARQFLPDTSEAEWLDRHGDIWLVNADGSLGRKSATLAKGTVTFTGTEGVIVPDGTPLSSARAAYETTEQITLGALPTSCAVIAVDAGIIGNMAAGETMSMDNAVSGIDGSAVVVSIDGGTDQETDDELRTRVLFRIREPPMGGDSNDYVAWALAVPGVTRAWSSIEMGIGTVTVRFMMDDLRVGDSGFPDATTSIKDGYVYVFGVKVLDSANSLTGGYTPVRAIRVGSGYKLLWHHLASDQYAIWGVDSGGIASTLGGLVPWSDPSVREFDVALLAGPDVTAVTAYLDSKRPVAVKDFFVESPLMEPVVFTVANLEPDTEAIRAAISASVDAMLKEKARPAYMVNGVMQEAQTIYAAWVSEAIMQAPGVEHFDLVMSDKIMPFNGSMAVLGTITYT